MSDQAPLLSPPSTEDAALWDKACLASGTSRGLAHEALASSVLLGWCGVCLHAAVPFAALALPVARNGALLHAQQAFGVRLESIELVHIPESFSDSKSWSARLTARHKESSLAAFALFMDEPIVSDFSSCLGASYDAEAFVPHRLAP